MSCITSFNLLYKKAVPWIEERLLRFLNLKQCEFELQVLLSVDDNRLIYRQ